MLSFKEIKVKKILLIILTIIIVPVFGFKIYFEVDNVLKQTIQILLRLRELPVHLFCKITGYEAKRFWEDLGYGAADT